jgi:hypothetical protein
MTFMSNILSRFFRIRKVRYNLISDAHTDVAAILQQLEDLGCRLQKKRLNLLNQRANESSICLAFVQGLTISELEDCYQKTITNRNTNVKFLVVSDCQLWKNRHDNVTVFNIPSTTHSFEIARTMHYLSLVG